MTTVPSPEQKAELALVRMMADVPLKHGQMLLLGPRAVAMMTGAVAFKPPIPDKFVLQREEWN